MDSEFVGLLVEIPFTITFSEANGDVDVVIILLTTTEVEIFKDNNGNKLVHNVYLNWQPGQAFPDPVGFINDEIIFQGKPEIHKVDIPAVLFGDRVFGKHTLTIHVNPSASAGLKHLGLDKRRTHNPGSWPVGRFPPVNFHTDLLCAVAIIRLGVRRLFQPSSLRDDFVLQRIESVRQCRCPYRLMIEKGNSRVSSFQESFTL